jgi:hypothetical protein
VIMKMKTKEEEEDQKKRWLDTIDGVCVCV